jgi:hypothetical protein
MPLASTMKYIAGFCSKTSRHCRLVPCNFGAAGLQSSASVLARFIYETLLSTAANIDAEFLAAKVIRREPAARASEHKLLPPCKVTAISGVHTK